MIMVMIKKHLSCALLLAVAFQARSAEAKTALLVIDVQDCFMEAAGSTSGQDGSLSVGATAEIIPLINEMRTDKSCLFDLVIRSQDFHPESHISFGPTHGLAPFAHLGGLGELPLTCVTPASGRTEDGSCCPTFHIEPYNCTERLCPDPSVSPARVLQDVLSSPACTLCKNSPEECFETTQAMWTNHCLEEGDSTFPLTLYTEESDIIVQKGGNKYVDSYSAFMDNTKKLKTPLDDLLTENEITDIYVVGIATDYCVYYSVIDAIGLGYSVNLVLDATRGIAGGTVEAAVADMVGQGATMVNSTEVLAMECPVLDDTSDAVWSMSGAAAAMMGAFATAALV
jgi:nicotinamidase-related amidase